MQHPAISDQTMVTLNVPLVLVNVVLKALADMPWKDSNNTIIEIRRQVAPQLAARDTDPQDHRSETPETPTPPQTPA